MRRIAWIGLAILLLVLAVSAFAIALGVAARRRAAERAHVVFQRKLARLTLSPKESVLLQRLVACRAGSEPEYLVLQSRPVFDACAGRMQRSEPVEEAVLHSLRLKIGFRLRRPDEAPATTSELPEGSTLVLAARPSRRLRAIRSRTSISPGYSRRPDGRRRRWPPISRRSRRTPTSPMPTTTWACSWIRSAGARPP